ncbi:MAG: ferritin-like domain-containing protein [Verrucomicrobiota bacterium]|nr:ferritin-like domain-containing protein [Verrucomicrobiota bacterium]MDQ6939533.1 ferritin-like domain-containing protein [Verrucomicrobiota bacterium]
MNSLEWLRYFEKNRINRPEPPWHVPSPLDELERGILARSLSHFQLGESGEGRFLLEQARAQARNDPSYARALALFIEEEKEHARLLERLVRRFGGSIIQRHWTHFLFRLLRRALGLNFEIQVLVIAEIVGTAYYRLLGLRTRDPVLEEVCALLLSDEAKHIEFHIHWLRDVRSRWLPVKCELWSLQFQLLFTMAANVALTDHRAALRSVGASKREFFREARGECIEFLRALNVQEQDRRRITAALISPA